jgi:hypothetical protein
MKPSEFNILKEVKYIIACAKNEEDKIVLFGNFVLFSTFMGDAWLLEQREHLALCLMQDGEENSYIIEDTPQKFMVGWNAQYHIDGDKFIIRQSDGKIVVKLDCPAKGIASVCS